MASPPFPLKVHIRGTGFPVLCLHGHPGSGQSLSVFTDPLARRFQTIAPDLRGYGSSQTRTAFEMGEHLTDLEALLDRYGIHRCLVLGWSLGGILAMELALRFPERISGLILVATAARPRGDHPPVTWQDNFYTGIASVVNWIVPGWEWNVEQMGKRSLYRYLIQQHTPGAYQHFAREALPAYIQTSTHATQALTRALRSGYDRLRDLEAIQCPCLMLAGEADRHITSASSLETARHLKLCEFKLYPNTAHLFPWEVPGAVIKDIEAWLERHPGVINPLEAFLSQDQET